MVKTYDICVIMNLNQKYILKLLFLQSKAYIFAGIYKFYCMPGRWPCGHSGAASLNFLCPEKFVLNIYSNKTKILLPNSLFCPPTLVTGLLCGSLHFHTWGILDPESANVSDFSPHIILQLVDIEYATSQLLW